MQTTFWRKFLIITSYIFYALAILWGVYVAVIWLFSSSGEDIFEPLTILLSLAAGAIGWVLARSSEALSNGGKSGAPAAPPPAQPPGGDYRKHYLKLVEYQCRFLDMKGMRTQSPHSLMLEDVFVDLGVAPRPFHEASTNPITMLPENLRTGQHAMWEYVLSRGMKTPNLAIIGAPGSGKTTILRHIALTLALPPRKRKHARRWKKLPLLLFLRDHAPAIRQEPDMTLVQAMENTLTRLGQQHVPREWFERQLQQGACLVMLDGLDEVADPDVRRQVVAWVEQQMRVYGANIFMITSRPFGYKNNPLGGVTVLEVQPFTPEQVQRFVHNWYRANEVMSAQRHDEGVHLRAWQGAEDLLRRLRDNPAIGELTVNPLLLTMIANVHRYRDSLPGSRVELYAEVCEVFLGRRQESYGMMATLKAQQKQSVLQPLAYYMMCQEQREIPLAEALPVIDAPLNFVTTEMAGKVFLQMVENSSGLLLEGDNELYSFAHQTFQEFLAAVHIREQGLVDKLIRHLGNEWWYETTRLYAAQADASPIIAACLNSDTPSVEALTLARDCADEAKGIQPDVRAQLEDVLTAGLESDDPARFRLAAGVLLGRRLREMEHWQPLDEQRAISTRYITCAEYQLFLDERRAQGEYYQPDHWTTFRFAPGQALKPVAGVRAKDTSVFCEWLNAWQKDKRWLNTWQNEKDNNNTLYRLPTPEESQAGPAHEHQDTLSAWCQTQAGAIKLDNPRAHAFDLDLARAHAFDRKLDLDVTDAGDLDRSLARARDRANDLDHACNLIRPDARAHANDFTRDLTQPSSDANDLANVLASAHDLANDLAHDLALANDIARTRARELANVLANASKRARDLANALDLDLTNDRHLAHTHTPDLARELANALARASNLARDLANDLARTRASNRAHDLARDLVLAQTRASNLAQTRASNLAHKARDGVQQRQALRHYTALLLLCAWLDYKRLEEANASQQWWQRWWPRQKQTDYAEEKDAVLVGYIWLEIVMQREEGTLPAWEGIRLVRERRRG